MHVPRGGIVHDPLIAVIIVCPNQIVRGLPAVDPRWMGHKAVVAVELDGLAEPVVLPVASCAQAVRARTLASNTGRPAIAARRRNARRSEASDSRSSVRA